MIHEHKPRVDWSNTARDYARYRQDYVPEFFSRLESMGVLCAGLRVADLGAGTGALARELARRGCSVIGIDVSEAMIAAAQQFGEQGSKLEFAVAPAESTRLPDASFDLVTAGTCWHWFDRARAAVEAGRILRRGGRLVIVAQDLIRIRGGVVEATAELVAEFYGLNEERRRQIAQRPYTFEWPRWLDDLIAAGFRRFECFGFEHDLSYNHDAWIGRMRASQGIGTSMTAPQQAAFSLRLGAMLKERFAAEPMILPHRLFAVIGTASR